MTPPALLLVGEPRHGVAVYAADVARAVAVLTGRDAAIPVDPAESTIAGPAHAHFTDRLWGSTPEDAAARFEALAAGGALTVTLHDLPQESDGPRNHGRRAACYRRVIAASRGVVVSSEHEAALLRDLAPAPRPLAVIPLPVAPPVEDARPDADGTAGVLGFFYPGKGHAEVVEAVAGTGMGVTVLGGPSAGHERDLDELVTRAEALGVPVHVTGWLDDDELMLRARRVSVPVLAHRHVSASGSLTAWLRAGRRPVVLENRYTAEMASLRPGTVVTAPLDGLAAAIGRARLDASSTWLDAHAVTRPHLDDTAAAHLAWWAEVAG